MDSYNANLYKLTPARIRDIELAYPGKTVMTSWNGTPVLVEKTPAIANGQREQELQASVSDPHPKGDMATFDDYLRDCPSPRSYAQLLAYGTRHQIGPQKMVQFELMARAAGTFSNDKEAMTFQPSVTRAKKSGMERFQVVNDPDPHNLKSMTFQPSVTMSTRGAVPGADEDDDGSMPMAPDPLDRDAELFQDPSTGEPEDGEDDDDATPVQLPDHASLQTLRRHGIVRPGMTRARFDARCKACGQSLRARMAQSLTAQAAGWFQVPAVPSANGDTMTPRYPGRTVDPGRKVVNELRASVDRLIAHVERGRGKGGC
jgi:hypothetical protein